MRWEQKFYDSQNELESVKSENEKLHALLSALQNENVTFKTKFAKSENALRNTEEKINSFQSTLTQLNQESRLLEERKNAGDDEIERLRLDNQKQLDEKYALLEELRNAQTSLKTDQQANATTVKNLKNEISNLQNELASGKKRETELNAKLKSLQDKLEKRESECRRLESEVEGAAAHLRLVGMQKASVTRELEQVYTSLSELEQQLSESRNENERLRLRRNVEALNSTGYIPSSSPRNLTDRKTRVDKTDSISRFQDVPRATVKISRRGSVEVIQPNMNGKVGLKSPSMVPLPGDTAKRSSYNRMHISQEYDKGTASTRRGTYYGMYSQPEANHLRKQQRTRSTADYPVLTPFKD